MHYLAAWLAQGNQWRKCSPTRQEAGLFLKLALCQPKGVLAGVVLSLRDRPRCDILVFPKWTSGRNEKEVIALDPISIPHHAGYLWIGTRQAGLFRFRDGNFVRVPTSHMEDREGDLWVGTGGGINRLRPCRFSLHKERHGGPVCFRDRAAAQF